MERPDAIIRSSIRAETVANSEDNPNKLAGAVMRVVRLKGQDARTWQRVGNLQFRLGRCAEAESAFRKSIGLDSAAFTSWNDLGDLLAYWKGCFDEAEAAYRKAVALEPENLDISLRLACVLVKRGKWDDAVGGDEYHEHHWPDIIRFFHDVVASGRADEAVALLDETKYGERWRPLREALQAIAEDDSSRLLRVSPEIRRPAEEIVAMLLPEGVRLGGAPKHARGRRTRRKRSLD